MKLSWIAAMTLSVISLAHADTETVVVVRHGEKPADGLGQLNCAGLNRALKLPAVLIGGSGDAAAIFAPNPSVRKEDDGRNYDYVRPLATIEPTAIKPGMPVNTQIGWSDIEALQRELEDKRYGNATVFVAWEHNEIEDLAKALLAAATPMLFRSGTGRTSTAFMS